MPSLKDVKMKIVGVGKTKQITKAMNMVASAKLRGAQARIERFRPYAGKYRQVLAELARKVEGTAHPLLAEHEEKKNCAIVLVTSDRGLCGSFNGNIITTALKLAAEKTTAGMKVSFACMGRKGRDAVRKAGYDIMVAYGDRMGNIAEYYHLDYDMLAFEETEQVSVEYVDDYLSNNSDITHVAFVHCETTTGILNPIKELSHIVKMHGKKLIVDCMSSFGGIPLDVNELGIDFLISSSNKCIQGVPGFGFIIARRSELKYCKGVARSLSLDIYDQWETMEKGHGKWRFTSPTHVVRAFKQALTELLEEGGVEARYQRYCENHRILVEGMRALGFKTLLEDDIQSPIITSFLYPHEGFDFKTFYYALKNKGFVIYPGKISKADTFRIGNIGDVHPEDFRRLVEVIRETKY